MSYKVYLWDSLGPIEWSQARWKKEGRAVSTAECDQELIHEVMLEHLPKDGLILDAGCGNAKWPLYLERRGYRVVGMDVSSEAVEIARENSRQLGLIRADTRRAPVRDGAFDAVLSLGVVEHDEAGPVASLTELHRILKPGGLLLLSVPFDNVARRLFFNHVTRFVTWKRRRAQRKLGFSEYRFNAREVRRALAESGFEPLRTYPNDMLPPRNIGYWVDHSNWVYTPWVTPEPTELFVLSGWTGRLVGSAIRHVPWLVCGEIVYLARAR